MPRKLSTTKFHGRQARPTPPEPVTPSELPWQQVPEVRRAVAEIENLAQQESLDSVDRARHLGSLLMAIRSRLVHGEWIRCASSFASFNRRTATRYVALAEWADSNPLQFKGAKSLALAKLHLLADLDDVPRTRLLARAVLIPGTDLRLTVAEMTRAQLASVITTLRVTKSKRTEIDAAIKSTRTILATAGRLVTTLIEHGDDIDHAVISEIHAELVQLAEQLQAAFDL